MSVKTLRAISDSDIDQMTKHLESLPILLSGRMGDNDKEWWADHMEMIENLRTEGRTVDVYYCDVCDAEIEDSIEDSFHRSFHRRFTCVTCGKHMCDKHMMGEAGDSTRWCSGCYEARKAKCEKERTDRKYREYLSLKEQFEKGGAKNV